MSIQKALCLICELPTADGAVSAVHVDKEKLKTWFLNACEYELAEEIEDDDLICYFCVCHAEFQWKFDEMADENLVWWNLDLDDAAVELRRNYFEEEQEPDVEAAPKKDSVDFNQAGVKMDETKKLRSSKKRKFPSCEEELSNANNSGRVCMKLNDIRICPFPNCPVVFVGSDSKEMSKKHMNEEFVDFNQAGVKMDETKKLRNSEFLANKKMKCLNCGEELSNANSYRHMCMKNNDIIICSFPNCPVVFCGSDRKEMSEKHMNEVHELKGNLDCDICKKKFETESKLKIHINGVHKTKPCGKCNEEVSLGYWVFFSSTKNLAGQCIVKCVTTRFLEMYTCSKNT
ncbi:Hypothetical predicted protein [Cloeon dipterum]|uniref:C2H2-type domain-containing protein n=1 Tax=Cloeon dipterum TaxID=197152 RepID=A0A8S1E2Q7_9INSE|nr:Hypothetical predicted protein [Cloeon dipterum]